MSVRRAATVAFVLASLGCGASPRMLHQSEAYYEHCHAADLDPDRSVDERVACWTAWVEHYVEGMPPERVLHARRRLAGLRNGEASEPLPDVNPAYTATFMALRADGPSASPEVANPEVANPEVANPEVANPEVANPEVPNPEVANPEVAGPQGADGPEVSSGPGRGTEPTVRRRPAPPRPLAPRSASPSHPCHSVCEPRWDACVDRVAGRGLDGLEACRIEHRVCLHGCL